MSSSEEKLQKEVEKWKGHLLDTSKRNRLLFSKIGKTNGLIELLAPNFETILQTVALDGKTAVLPVRKNLISQEQEKNFSRLSIEKQNELVQKSSKNRADYIFTNLDDSHLSNKLKGLRKKSNDAMKEKGFNILFLTFGVLKWKEAESDTEINEAPLLVMPVRLFQVSRDFYYCLERLDDSLLFNTTLGEYLQRTFGIALPRFTEANWTLEPLKSEDDFSDENQHKKVPEGCENPSDFNSDSEADTLKPANILKWFERIDDFLANKKWSDQFNSWKVEKKVGLGLLSFSRIEIYEDMSQHTKEILANPLCREIAGVSEIRNNSPEINKDTLDKVFSPLNVFSILDADNSQETAILAVQKGQNIVLDGPPGTGKSQTIANIIADFIGHGKSVLFVSEKMAALEVVKRRLDDANLGDFCLNCHDTKRPRKEIVNELSRCLNLSFEKSPEFHSKFAKLEICQENLRRYTALLHTPVETCGITLRQALERLSTLINVTPNTTWRIPEPLKLTEREIENRENIIQRFENCFLKLPESEKPWSSLNPWHDLWFRSLTRTETDDFFRQTELVFNEENTFRNTQFTLANVPFLSLNASHEEIRSNLEDAEWLLQNFHTFPRGWFQVAPEEIFALFRDLNANFESRIVLMSQCDREFPEFLWNSSTIKQLDSEEFQSFLDEIVSIQNDPKAPLENEKSKNSLIQKELSDSNPENSNPENSDSQTSSAQTESLQLTTFNDEAGANAVALARFADEKTAILRLQDLSQKMEGVFSINLFEELPLSKWSDFFEALKHPMNMSTVHNSWKENLPLQDSIDALQIRTLFSESEQIRNELESQNHLRTTAFQSEGEKRLTCAENEFQTWRAFWEEKNFWDGVRQKGFCPEYTMILSKIHALLEKAVLLTHELAENTGLTRLNHATTAEIPRWIEILKTLSKIHVFDPKWSETPFSAQDRIFQRNLHRLFQRKNQLVEKNDLLKRFAKESFSPSGLTIMTSVLQFGSLWGSIFGGQKRRNAFENARALYTKEPERNNNVLKDARIFKEIMEICTNISKLLAETPPSGYDENFIEEKLPSYLAFIQAENSLNEFERFPEFLKTNLNNNNIDFSTILNIVTELEVVLQEITDKKIESILTELQQTSSTSSWLSTPLNKLAQTFAQKLEENKQRWLEFVNFLDLYSITPNDESVLLQNMKNLRSYWQKWQEIKHLQEHECPDALVSDGETGEINSWVRLMLFEYQLHSLGIKIENYERLLETVHSISNIQFPDCREFNDSANGIVSSLSESQGISAAHLLKVLENAENHSLKRRGAFQFFKLFLKDGENVTLEKLTTFLAFASTQLLPIERNISSALLKLSEISDCEKSIHKEEFEKFKTIFQSWEVLSQRLGKRSDFPLLSTLLCVENPQETGALQTELIQNLEVLKTADQKLCEVESQLETFVSADRITDFKKFFETAQVFEKLTKLSDWQDGRPLFATCIRYSALAEEAQQLGLAEFFKELQNGQMEGQTGLDVFRKRFFLLWLESFEREHPEFTAFNESRLDEWTHTFRTLDKEILAGTSQRIRSQLLGSPDRFNMTESNQRFGAEIRILKKENNKQKRHHQLRTLFGEIPGLLRLLKPCMMMSPLTVSTYLGANTNLFDLVIFDEASQLNPWEAVNAIYRGHQLVVAGDDKQLPPSNYFSAFLDDGEDWLEEPEETDSISNYESLLTICKSNGFTNRRLCWHYRSHHEGLIAFSNRFFYENELITFPSPKDANFRTGISFEFLPEGRWRTKKKDTVQSEGSGFNPIEARRTAELIVEHFRQNPDESLGVITPNKMQQEAVEDLLEQMRREDESINTLLANAECEDQKEPFFIKNLETVQGDERDFILFSIGYGPTEDSGAIYLKFGPLNQNGGERRLNVAITRARKHLTLISSMRYLDFDPSGTRYMGPKMLQKYLEYAERGPEMFGDLPTNSPDDDNFDYKNNNEKISKDSICPQSLQEPSLQKLPSNISNTEIDSATHSQTASKSEDLLNSHTASDSTSDTNTVSVPKSDSQSDSLPHENMVPNFTSAPQKMNRPALTRNSNSGEEMIMEMETTSAVSEAPILETRPAEATSEVETAISIKLPEPTEPTEPSTPEVPTPSTPFTPSIPSLPPISAPPCSLEDLIAKELQQRGLILDRKIGCSGYRIDLAVRHPQYPDRYLLAIESDGKNYRETPTVRDRDRLRQEILESRNWGFCRVWATDWFEDSKRQILKIMKIYLDKIQNSTDS